MLHTCTNRKTVNAVPLIFFPVGFIWMAISQRRYWNKKIKKHVSLYAVSVVYVGTLQRTHWKQETTEWKKYRVSRLVCTSSNVTREWNAKEKAKRQNSQDIHQAHVYIKKKLKSYNPTVKLLCLWTVNCGIQVEWTKPIITVSTCKNLMLTMPELQCWDDRRGRLEGTPYLQN